METRKVPYENQFITTEIENYTKLRLFKLMIRRCIHMMQYCLEKSSAYCTKALMSYEDQCLLSHLSAMVAVCYNPVFRICVIFWEGEQQMPV